MKENHISKSVAVGIIVLFIGAGLLPIVSSLNFKFYTFNNSINILSDYKRVQNDIIFSDNFDDGDISDWTVVTTGSGVFEVSSDEYVSPPYSVHMNSKENSKAMGESPVYDLNLSKDYNVSFDFFIPDTDNHWFEVFNNHHIYLLIDYENDLKYYDGQNAGLIMELNTDEWYRLKLIVYISSSTYDVFIDNQFKLSCPFWIHSGWEDNFRIGDRADGSTDKGEAFWDNFMIIQNQSIPNNPPDKPVIKGPPNGKPGIEYTFCITTTDPDGDSLHAIFDWGDGTSSGWLGTFESGEEICDNHTWNDRGNYIITVTLRDDYGATVTATLEISIPRARTYCLRFADMFPILQRILNYIL